MTFLLENIFTLTEAFCALTHGLDIIKPTLSFLNPDEGSKPQKVVNLS